MKILAVDTATNSCSVAIIDEGLLLIEMTTVTNQTHSKRLMGIINTCLEMSGLTLSKIDGFAVTIGPGSFTGLRIGISAVKGFAFAQQKPIIGISSLEALAWQCSPSTYLICPILDARKKEVYYCRYRFAGGELKKLCSESIGSPAEAVYDITEPCILVGNGVQIYQDTLLNELGDLATFAAVTQHVVRAASVASLSLGRFSDGEPDDVAMLVPHYIRKSDAEMNAPQNRCSAVYRSRC